jgi:hypothetical protein
MADQPRMVRTNSGLAAFVGVSAVGMAVMMPPYLGQIPVRVVASHGIAPPAAHHPRLVGAFLAGLQALPQTRVHPQVSRRHGSPRQLPAIRAWASFVESIETGPLAELPMLGALIRIQRHLLPRVFGEGDRNMPDPPIAGRYRARAKSAFDESTCFCGPVALG